MDEVQKYNPPDNRYIPLDVPFARAYGVNNAILVAKLYRLEDKWQGKLDENGVKWVRLSLDDWLKELPFKDRTIRRTIETSEQSNLIFSRVFTGRCKWYRCNPEYIDLTGQSGQMQLDKVDSSYGQSGQLPNSFPNSDLKKDSTFTDDIDTGQIELAIIEVCKIAVSDNNKLALYRASRDAINKHHTVDQIRQFSEWFAANRWESNKGQTPPSLKHIIEYWPQFEDTNKTQKIKIGAR